MDLEQRLEAEQLYTAAVGSRADFYVPKFIAFDTYDGSRTSWNWAAFFFTFPWMLYRRMYGYAAVYFLLVPVVSSLMLALIAVAFPARVATFFLLAFAAVVNFIAPSMFANAMYHTTIADRIRKAGDSFPTLEEQVEALQGQRSTNVVALIIGIVVATSAGAWGWYQRDVRAARDQVAVAIAHTGYVQADLEVFYLRHGRWPRDGAEMNLDDSAKGRFTETMEVSDGRIRVTFGGASARALQGRLLLMEPHITSPSRFDWVCVVPDASVRSVPERYWPPTCDTRSRPIP